MASTTNEDTNPKLPSWSGEWATFKAYELKVGLEIDGTREDERKLLGPRLAKNLVGKAWELIEEVDRAKLREETGAEYLLAFLKKQRGKDKVDLMGDALRDLFMKPMCIEKKVKNLWTTFQGTVHMSKPLTQL
jgi:hypothetical protein